MSAEPELEIEFTPEEETGTTWFEAATPAQQRRWAIWTHQVDAEIDVGVTLRACALVEKFIEDGTVPEPAQKRANMKLVKS